MGLSRARPRSWSRGFAALAATLVVLSGCGGSSSSGTAGSSSTGQTSQTSQSADQFKAAITPILNQFKSASQATGAVLQHARYHTDTQLAGTFQQLAAKWKAALTKLETLQPPPQLTAAYSRLKNQVTSVNLDLVAIASAAQNHNAGAAKGVATQLIRDILSAKATSTTFTNGSP